MSAIVFFHAHPDDEAILTGCTIAKAAAGGHRGVVVFATAGEHGETPAAGLGPDETLGDRRTHEAQRAASILGAAHVEFLGFKDSGMAGDQNNDHPESFWSADTEVAARRLAQILLSENASALTIYDSRGGYGHPDHIKVHDVGVRAAQMAGTPCVYEATTDRDYLLGLMDLAVSLRARLADLPDREFVAALGVPGSRITHEVDGTDVAATKRTAMAAHASQVAETSIFLGLPEELFPLVWGREWFIQLRSDRRGEDPFEQLSIRRSPPGSLPVADGERRDEGLTDLGIASPED